MGLLESVITSESELHEREYFYGSQTILQLCYSTYIQFMKYLPRGAKTARRGLQIHRESITFRVFYTKPAEIHEVLISWGIPSWPAEPLSFSFWLCMVIVTMKSVLDFLKKIRKKSQRDHLDFCIRHLNTFYSSQKSLQWSITKS